MRSGDEQPPCGFSLNFFSSMVLEPEVPDEAMNSIIFGRNILRIIMSGWNEKWTDLISWKTFKAVFINHDHQRTNGFRLAFQEGLLHIFSQLKNSNLSPSQHSQAQQYISNCLMFLPFADLTPYESMAIPQWMNNQWRLIDYKVIPIELTPTHGFEKLFIKDNDRVFAFGLEPILDAEASPHLIFMGTSYPAGQGFSSSIDTDFEPFETTGKKLYRTGKANLTRWLENQIHKVHVCGTSLGGSLSYLLAIDQGEKLSRVDALNPPGLYSPLFRKSRFDHWDELAEKPEVHIQQQGNDPVSRLGKWKSDWHVTRVIPSPENKRFNWFTDHAFNYAGLPGNQLIDINVERDNKERALRSLVIYTILRSSGYILFMAPYRYAILPAFRLVASNLLAFAMMTPFFITQFSAAFPSILALSMPPVVILISTLTAASFSVYLCYKMAMLLPILLGTKEVELHRCHDPRLPRNPSMDMYTNVIEAEFTSKEIDIYYQARNEQESSLPQPPRPHSTFFKAAGVVKTKEEVLAESRQSTLQGNPVICSATKAKIYEMKKTIQLVNRFGFHSEKLRSALRENRQAYLLGKVQPDPPTLSKVESAPDIV